MQLKRALSTLYVCPLQSEWPAYTSSYNVSYDPFGDGTAFGAASITVDSSAG
jgi:hypothetical protein